MAATRYTACLLFAVFFIFVFSPTAEATGRKIIVGGNAHWIFGFNYTDWAAKTAPFFVGDTLVFIYKESMFNGMPVNHNVYQLHSYKQFEACSFAKSIELANTTMGVPGFEYVLKGKYNYYFACEIANGIHCSTGLMKFAVKPI